MLRTGGCGVWEFQSGCNCLLAAFHDGGEECEERTGWGWPLALSASPVHRGPGLPGAEPHWHDPFRDVGWRCGVHPLAHAGEVSQQEELTWNCASLASPGMALGNSKANSSL